MSDVAISCAGIGKQYRIGERERYKALRDVITDAMYAPFRRMQAAFTADRKAKSPHDQPSIWALRDVSFEVKRGDVVGLIGRNGAGKSTLLKILSRITEPSEGSAQIYGRVGSLLEVGTGFHPELTGRENIYLNGAILGMKKAEIARKFDEIVAFAEVEKFIDTPVKRYSSGMYVRLAFAVAAHLETEILLVDEVLAVGDAQFQKKCLGKMGDVAKHGRTVLFVSHNLLMVQRLCPTAIVLHDGHITFQGGSGQCVRRYSESGEENTRAAAANSSDGALAIHRVRIFDSAGIAAEAWKYGRPITVEVDVAVRQPCPKLAVDITFYSTNGLRLFGLQSDRWHAAGSFEPGHHTISFRIENPGISVPEMYIDVGLRTAAAGYDVLLPHAAYLFVKSEQLPAYASPIDLITPLAGLEWSTTSSQSH
ncbi:MAG TPA: ABC transporter ATP-binding protein [Terriglobales bacterium]|nr:ABC transporter ATP-binding protein [Terriglobales bacterium]